MLGSGAKATAGLGDITGKFGLRNRARRGWRITKLGIHCLLYTSDAADE